MDRVKSDAEIASEGANADSGFCNPMKVQLANEARTDAIFALEDRGYTRAEAEQMVRDAEQE